MKLVSVLVVTMFLSFGAAAQTTSKATPKRTVAKTHQKQKIKKAKTIKLKTKAENTDVTTLVDEKAHKAKWSFDEMLKRRLEIDAEEGESQQRVD